LGKEYAEYKKHVTAGNWELSLEHARSSYEIGKVLFKPEDKNNAALAFNYGHNLVELKQYKEANPVLNEALDLYEAVYGEEAKELIPVLTDLGLVNGADHIDGNLKYQKQVLEISEKTHGKDSLEHGQLLIEAGAENLNIGQSEQARKNIYNGYEILARQLDPSSDQLAYASFIVGKYEISVAKYETAIEYLNKTLATFDEPDQPTNQLELLTHGFLVHAYESLEQRDRATQHCLAIGRMTPLVPNQDIQPLFRKDPDYPFSELQDGKTGYATIEFDVDEKGFVRNARAIDGSGANFKDSAINAIEKWRYAPSFVNGKPTVRENAQTMLRFELE